MTDRKPFAEISPGVLGTDHLSTLIRDGSISAHRYKVEPEASATDLPISDGAWEVGEGQRPTIRGLLNGWPSQMMLRSR
jgi:hypothetical protein